jgi:hypothetical protein
VALLARDRLVRTGKRELSKVVIEACLPAKGRDCVAVRTLDRKTGGHVIRVSRGNIICPVTADARDRRSNVLMAGSIRMAILANERCVSANQRESRELMTLHHIRNLPGLIRVTPGAIGTEFRPVHIRVTRCTPFADRFELQTCVTIGAGDRPVLSLKHKPRLIVIEFGIRSHTPRIRGVTRFARNLDVAVWGSLCRKRGDCEKNRRHEECQGFHSLVCP